MLLLYMTLITFFWDILIEILLKIEDEINEFVEINSYILSEEECYEYDIALQYIYDSLLIIG